jgi:putative PIN family toxin of toxin-antitoxin system
MSLRIVIDTNIYVSRALRVASVPGMAVDKAWLEATTLLSAATWAELQAVLKRAKFAPYIRPGTLGPYLDRVRSISTFVSISTSIRACSDSKDDKFLELAVDGRADLIMTGDADLLSLHPFRGIHILSPRDYLKLE